MSSNRLSLLDLSTSVGVSTIFLCSICDTFLGYMDAIWLSAKGRLLFVLHFITKRRIFLPLLARHLKAQSLRLWMFHTSSRPNLKRILERTGILTGHPSTTPPYNRGLMLGSPNPQTNNVAEETLDISTWQILTAISLLMPAFSLLATPPLRFRGSFTVTRTLSYWSIPINRNLSYNFGVMF